MPGEDILIPDGREFVYVERAGEKQVQSSIFAGKVPFTATGGITARTAADRAGDVQNIRNHGAVGDGSTSDTAALQGAIDALDPDDGGTVFIPHGEYNCASAPITVYTKNVRITGPGILKNASFVIDGLSADPVVDLYADLDGVKIHHDLVEDEIVAASYAIVLQRCAHVKVRNCDIRNVDRAVSITAIDATQHVKRAFVIQNDINNVNYGVYVDRPANPVAVFTTGDIYVDGNMIAALKLHFYANGLDGAVFTRNTCFFPGSALESSIKEQNVYIDLCNWLVVAANNLFEAGKEGVYVARAQNVNIGVNNIAWCGQRIPSSAIKIDVSDNGDAEYVMGSVAGNSLQFPTKSGVEIDGICGHIVVGNNIVTDAGNDTYYYGATDLGTVDHFGVVTGANTTDIIISNNMCKENALSLSGTRCIGANNRTSSGLLSTTRFKQNTGTDTTLDCSDCDVFLLAQAAPTSVTSLGSDPGHGNPVSLFDFSGNTTLVHSSSLRLKGGINAALPANGAMTVRYLAGQWVEMSRNF